MGALRLFVLNVFIRASPNWGCHINTHVSQSCQSF